MLIFFFLLQNVCNFAYIIMIQDSHREYDFEILNAGRKYE